MSEEPPLIPAWKVRPFEIGDAVKGVDTWRPRRGLVQRIGLKRGPDTGPLITVQMRSGRTYQAYARDLVYER
ncbi:hypothetical protein [Embleya sp. AB8]|uniref:hypothetical protein n=1 Tax=Embleya sp. AB8 TaxID=3156304 RepID=UPI003C74ADEB